MVKPFLPSRLTRIPDKSKFFQSVATFGRQFVFFYALDATPVTQRIAVFSMALWDVTMTFTLIITFQIAKAYFPIRIMWSPIKAQSIKSCSAFT